MTRGLVIIGALMFIVAMSTARSAGSAGSADRIALVGYGTSATQAASGVARAPDAGGSPGHVFLISGSASGLYPGAAQALVLTVTNPFRFSITIGSITTTVSGASPLCAGSYLSVSAFSGALVVPALQLAHVSVALSMLSTAPDACQGAVFVLRYSGSATRS